MPPENAVGALARCKQVMVVGDINQLPPTNFFQKVLDDDEEDEEAVSDESILEMATGIFRPVRKLRWHYRSRHSGLIQFSNTHVYDDALVIFPSPTESRTDMGVSLVQVEGNYKAGINYKEASVIVKAALNFMHLTPHRSLGIVALNQKQSELIQEEMDRELIKDAQATQYVDNWLERNDGLESFFIKNLENVQGDERDVIFIGTVYGPESYGGPVMQRFGPINGKAGKRRLNVLFTRAKEQIITFSSMSAADIKAEKDINPGAYMLKCWLEYSATGRQHEGTNENREPDSDFEEYVINRLKAIGCVPIPQVGVGGGRIDIGVRHPEWPHGYILGIECDGATYHSSRSSRERDRLREEVLTNLGWKLYRIWSTSWFENSHNEAEKLRDVITKRLHELKCSGSPFIHVSPFESKLSFIEEVPPVTMSRQNFIEQQVDEPSITPFNESIVVEIGDTVKICFLDGEKSIREITLSDRIDAPDQGIIHITKPLGRELLDRELGDEIEILTGNSLRKARIEDISKANTEVKH